MYTKVSDLHYIYTLCTIHGIYFPWTTINAHICIKHGTVLVWPRNATERTHKFLHSSYSVNWIYVKKYVHSFVWQKKINVTYFSIHGIYSVGFYSTVASYHMLFVLCTVCANPRGSSHVSYSTHVHRQHGGSTRQSSGRCTQQLLS